MALSEMELRVLGALVEKERTTPDAYPLSTQALVTACNQITNRDPVTDYHLQEVRDTTRRLRDRGLASTVQEVADRVPKHRHLLDRALDVDATELALLAVLMLRGPQTASELRTRTERYGGVGDQARVEGVLARLAEREPPLVRNVGRSPGQGQDRWCHALGLDEGRLQPRARTVPRPTGEPSTLATPGAAPTETDLERRLSALEARVAALEARGLGE